MQIRLYKETERGLNEVSGLYRKQGFAPSLTELGNVLLLQAIKGRMLKANGGALKRLKR